MDLNGSGVSAMADFFDFGLPSWLIKQCESLGFQSPTEVQKACIPPTLKGRDILGCAKTGSGKTAAFLVPILSMLSKDPYGVFAVIISPTRELACQIVDQAKVLGRPMNLRVSLVCGGLDRADQSREVSAKPHIVVATPGRLAELLEHDEGVTINKIKFLVFDEADRLFEESMAKSMKTIIDHAPPKRQTLLYSATMTSVLQQILKLAKNDPFQWSNDESETTVQELDQKMVFVAKAAKDTYLVHFVKAELEKDPESQIIVFTSTCKHCQSMSHFLQQVDCPNVALNSAMRQKLRLLSISKFKSKYVRVLVTTDVGSRGLDIPDVQLVLNYNVPFDPDTYIHRVGRTARAGASGRSVMFVSPEDKKAVLRIENRIKKELEVVEVDEEEHILPIMMEVTVGKRKADLSLDKRDFFAKHDKYKEKSRKRKLDTNQNMRPNSSELESHSN